MTTVAPVASPEVVAAWVAGWAVSRGVRPPLPVLGGRYVTVGSPQQQARYVFASIADDDLRRLASEIAAPWIFLKVCKPTTTLDGVWPPGWVVQPEGFMMTVALTPSPSPSLPPGYALTVDEGRAIVATVCDPTGFPVASGKIALADGYATFDQIGTDESHRRLGLGRAVMAALSAEALARGIRHAVLVATPVGRSLYEAGGWQLHAHFTTAVIPGESG